MRFPSCPGDAVQAADFMTAGDFAGQFLQQPHLRRNGTYLRHLPHAELLSTADLVVFIDCSAVVEPGVLSTIPMTPAHALPRIFTHHLDPASLLKLAQDLYGRIPSQAMAITVGGQSFELNEQLSKPVTAAIPIAVEVVRRAYANAEQEWLLPSSANEAEVRHLTAPSALSMLCQD
jgi:hydrogenase maturation protease